MRNSAASMGSGELIQLTGGVSGLEVRGEKDRRSRGI
jgi:hypothetical protein